MNRRQMLGLTALGGLDLLLSGCSSNPTNSSGSKQPTFTLSWSEYPSWSVFGVAVEEGLIDPDPNKLGTIESKWNVKIKLDKQEYEKCTADYAAKTVDAVCMTNMDALEPASRRKSVAVLPTSTSNGGDALIVVPEIKSVEQLRDEKIVVYGLKESVSHYAFLRIIEKKGLKSSDFKYEDMEPANAARAMQNKQKNIQAIMVWNPFGIETLHKRKGTHALFSSRDIPNEIIDMVVIGQDVLEKPGGPDFACALIDTFYAIAPRLDDPGKRDDLLVKLGSHFANFNKDDMDRACQETRFFTKPDDGVKWLTGDEFRTKMDDVRKFWEGHQFLKGTAPTIGHGNAATSSATQLRFDPTYIKNVQEKK